MSSTNKTDYLRLNRWLSSDIPKMEDFNNDNVIIDTAIQSHTSDTVGHITGAEREGWNNQVFLGVYFGNGELNRTINTGCGFEPKVAMVYALGKPMTRVDFSQQKKYNYLAVSTAIADCDGFYLDSETGNFSVKQQVTSTNGEYSSLNEGGTTYIYILMR